MLFASVANLITLSMQLKSTNVSSLFSVIELLSLNSGPLIPEEVIGP